MARQRIMDLRAIQHYEPLKNTAREQMRIARHLNIGSLSPAWDVILAFSVRK